MIRSIVARVVIVRPVVARVVVVRSVVTRKDNLIGQ